MSSEGTDRPVASEVASEVARVDVLAGWDPAGPPPVLDGSAPFPTDTVVAVGAMVAGMAIGVVVGGRRPFMRTVLNAKLGGILGLAAAVVGRRMWRLPG